MFLLNIHLVESSVESPNVIQHEFLHFLISSFPQFLNSSIPHCYMYIVNLTFLFSSILEVSGLLISVCVNASTFSPPMMSLLLDVI